MQYPNNKIRVNSSCVKRDASGYGTLRRDESCVKGNTQYASLPRAQSRGRNTIYDKTGLTLLEMIIAMAIMVIVFAAIVPQFRIILNSWDSRQAGAEVLQNGRVLIDHINRNLSKAVKITAVEPNLYIQFLDNDSNTYQYDINPTSGYVRYGRVGYTPSDLAGPVSSLTFTCYDACDIATADVNDIRYVEVETTVINSVSASQNKTLTTSAYLRTNDESSECELVGCWKLDETSGTTAADSSGKGNDGTLVNMTPPGCWVPGQIGNALAFDGTNDYVDLGTDSSLNFGSSEPFTVAAWVKTTENYGMIVSFRSSTDGGPVIDLAVGYEGGADDPGKAMILVRQDGGSGGYANVKGGSVNDGQWHHMAAVRISDGTVELFLDGVFQGANSGAESGGAITTNLRAIGSERRWVSDVFGTADQRYLVGTIDDVRIYNRALTAAEILQLANALRYMGFIPVKQGSDTTSITISTPDTNTGDLLIAAVATDGDTSTTITTAAAGWTLINCGADDGDQVTLGAWYKVAGTSEPAPIFTWSAGNPQQAYGWMMQFRGNDTNPATVINDWNPGQSSVQYPTSPAVTTNVDNCIILRLGAFDENDITVGSPGLSGHTTITMDASAAATTTAIPTFVAAGAVTSGTGTIIPALPAGIATGDILLLFLETSNQAISISNQNGGTWTQVANSPQGTGNTANGTRLTAFWSRYNGTQGNPTTSDSGNHQLGRIVAIRGAVASGNPWDVTAGGIEATSDTSGSIPGATTTVNNTLIVAAIAASLPDSTITTNFGTWTNANLTNITELIDNAQSAGNGGALGVTTGGKATAGAYVNTTVTLANSAYKGMMSIALKPPAAVNGTVSGGAGYIKQSTAGLSSGTPTFSLTASNEARMLTIAIAPDPNGGGGGCGGGGQVLP